MTKHYRSNEDQNIDVTKVGKLKTDPVWDGMGLADFQRFARYARTVADALGLTEWTISIHLRPDTDEDNLASIKVALQSRFATLSLSHCFASEPRRLQQITIIHEVLHIYFEPLLSTLTEDVLPSALGQQSAAVAASYLGVEKERTIDAMAVALSPLLPPLPKQ